MALTLEPEVHVLSSVLVLLLVSESVVLAFVDEGDGDDDEAFVDDEEESTEDEREESDEPDEEDTSDVSDVTETLIIWPISRRTALSQQFVPFTLQHQKPRPWAGQGITYRVASEAIWIIC